MQKLYESLNKKGIEVVAISIDRTDQGKVQEYAKQYHLTFPVLLDPDQKIRKNYYIMGLPTSYLIDASGKLRGFVSGAREWDSAALGRGHAVIEGMIAVCRKKTRRKKTGAGLSDQPPLD